MKNMKYKAIDFCGGGIKCDNPQCDFIDCTVELEDYINWLNKPCPKCDSNLLTQADYDNVQTILSIVKIANDNVEPTDDFSEECTMTFHMNGSGKVNIEID